jgi:hypothetical protein
MQTLIERIFHTSRRIKNGRSQYAVLAKAGEEFGELSQEVMIANGDHYKAPGNDGIIGEAIDLIICCTDIIQSANPNITEEELTIIADRKLNKWELSAVNEKPGCIDNG